MTPVDSNSAAAFSQEPELELRCPGCDYDLRGTSSDRCAECGLLIDRAALSESQIPWSHRAKIGRIRAYWKTVRWVLRGGRAIALELTKPVSYQDARSFQRITVMLAFLPLAALGLWVYIASLPNQRGGSWLGWILEYVGIGFAAACLWMFLMAATGAAGYFFHPPWLPTHRQNSAVSLSCYACAPLGWMPFVVPLTGIFICINALPLSLGRTRLRVEEIFECVVWGWLGVMIIVTWWRTLTLLRATTRCGLSRLIGLAIYLPVAWIILATIFLGVLPLAYLVIALMILSAAGH